MQSLHLVQLNTCCMLMAVLRSIQMSSCRHVVKLEDPRPLTRHLIFVYCWNMENYSSGWSMTAPFDTWFIAKHGDCRLACTGDCSQKQLAVFRPSQRDSIHTDAAAWLLACVPATISTICYTLQYICLQCFNAVGWAAGRPVKNWVVGCWRGYLPGARCRLACGPADATATHCLLLQ